MRRPGVEQATYSLPVSLPQKCGCNMHFAAFTALQGSLGSCVVCSTAAWQMQHSTCCQPLTQHLKVQSAHLP